MNSFSTSSSFGISSLGKEAVSNFTSVPFDVIVLLLVVGAFFLLFNYFQKGKGVGAILSFYLASLLFMLFPYKSNVRDLLKGSPGVLPYVDIFLFAVFFAIFFVLLGRLIYMEHAFTIGRKWFESGLLALSALVLILVITNTLIPISHWYTFNPWIDQLFIKPTNDFLWLLAPLLVLFYVGL